MLCSPCPQYHTLNVDGKSPIHFLTGIRLKISCSSSIIACRFYSAKAHRIENSQNIRREFIYRADQKKKGEEREEEEEGGEAGRIRSQ